LYFNNVAWLDGRLNKSCASHSAMPAPDDRGFSRRHAASFCFCRIISSEKTALADAVMI
jgi:hypothetical protein